MMALRVNSHLLSLLEAYDIERLNAILSWLTPTDEPVESSRLSSVVQEPDANNSEIKPMVPLSVLNTVKAENQDSQTNLPVHELVHFSLLDEFGPTLSEKQSFVWLSHQVSKRLQGQFS